LSKRVRCGARWMSADEIAGPPLSSDVFLIDLNAKF
jgi:Putative porin